MEESLDSFRISSNQAWYLVKVFDKFIFIDIDPLVFFFHTNFSSSRLRREGKSSLNLIFLRILRKLCKLDFISLNSQLTSLVSILDHALVIKLQSKSITDM